MKKATWGATRWTTASSRPTALIQLGARHLNGFLEQHVELGQNRDRLAVDVVQMKRRYADGWLILNRAKEHGGAQEAVNFLGNLINSIGPQVVVERNERGARRAEQAALAA